MKRLETRKLFVLPYLLVFGAALLRLTVSHPYNFVPVFACLLFFGANRPKREFAIPLLTLVGVDMFLTMHRYGYLLTADHAVTWMWYLAAAFLWRHNAAQLAIDSTRAWRFTADLDFVLPGQQLCGVGCVGHVCKDLERPRNLLYCRGALLPQQPAFRDHIQPADFRTGQI